MARALIRINGVDSQFATVAIGATVSLTNHDEGGEVSYLWQIVDQPEGTADNLSTTGVENVTFVPTKEGSYELKLTVNAALSTVAVQTAIVAVLDARTGERVPAATETVETSASAGWAPALKRILARTLHATVDANLVIAQTPGGIAAGALVTLTATATINSGTQAAFTVTRLAAALGTAFHRDRIGILIDGVAPGTVTANSLVLVRTFGLVPFSGSGSPAVGDPVYLSNAGLPALTAGTVPRMVGFVVSSSGGSYQWAIDSGVIPSGTRLNAQRFTANGTYTPTPGTTRVVVRMCGGGGGGGGATATAGVNSLAAGGASGVSIEFELSGGITGGAVTIGAGGTGGTSAGGTGVTGGDTTAVINANTFLAKGGTGGIGSTASGTVTVESGGSPQSGSSSTGQQTAENGQDGVIFTSSGGGGGWQGRGGASRHGIGGQRAGLNTAPATPAGFGGGGAGAAANNGSASGGAGAGGIMLIEEYA